MDQNIRLMKHKKSVMEMDLIDDFLFGESLMNPETADLMTKIIIERATGLKVKKLLIDCQKTIHGFDTEYHGIRLDLSASEIDIREENAEIVRIYDIEPDNTQTGNLPKRNRYYQSLMDVKLLETSVDYDRLPELWSIWILSHDPFGGNRMIYTVKNVVEEMPQIAYNDGVRKIFLYTDGELGGNAELQNLLRYIRHTSRHNAVDPELKKLHTGIVRLKNSRKIGVRYMMELQREIEKWKRLIDEAKKEAEEQVSDRITEEVTERVTEEVTERVTEEVTERVTEEITERVTEEVTERVTEEITERVTEYMVKSLIETCMELGASKEETTDRLTKKINISPETAQIYIRQYWTL